MIGAKEIIKLYNKCYNCNVGEKEGKCFYHITKVIIRENGSYRHAQLSVSNQFVTTACEAEIAFCETCWKDLAGNQYTFEEDSNRSIFLESVRAGK